jgi:hypothetical protein
MHKREGCEPPFFNWKLAKMIHLKNENHQLEKFTTAKYIKK